MASALPSPRRSPQTRSRGERIRRIGVLAGGSAADQEKLPVIPAFVKAQLELGWIEGRNLVIDYRFTDVWQDRLQVAVAELVALGPEVILSAGMPRLAAATCGQPVVQ